MGGSPGRSYFRGRPFRGRGLSISDVAAAGTPSDWLRAGACWTGILLQEGGQVGPMVYPSSLPFIGRLMNGSHNRGTHSRGRRRDGVGHPGDSLTPESTSEGTSVGWHRGKNDYESAPKLSFSFLFLNDTICRC